MPRSAPSLPVVKSLVDAVRHRALWLGLCALLAACAPDAPVAPVAALLPLRLGTSNSMFSTPLIVAEEKGYFAEEGLDVSLTHFQSGKAALEGMLAGSVDVSPAADAPLVAKAFECDCYRIVATFIYSHSHGKITARRDRGIASAADLRGKRIGVTPGTTGEYYLLYALLPEGIGRDDVTLVQLPPKDLVSALVEGSIDAFSSWEPYVWQAKDLLGDLGVLLVNENVLRHTFNLTTTPGYADTHQVTLVRLLRAVQKSAEFMTEHPAEAKEIITRRLGVRAGYLEEVYEEYKIGLRLDHFLLLTMEAEARWQQEGPHKGTALPNFLHYIDARALREARPEAVRLIQ